MKSVHLNNPKNLPRVGDVVRSVEDGYPDGQVTIYFMSPGGMVGGNVSVPTTLSDTMLGVDECESVLMDECGTPPEDSPSINQATFNHHRDMIDMACRYSCITVNELRAESKLPPVPWGGQVVRSIRDDLGNVYEGI